MTSFFGSIRSLFKGKDKPGQPTRLSKYEDEIKLLLDTVVLSNPSVLSGGFTIFGPASSPMPTLSEAMRGGKMSIKSLCELLIGMTYMTEKGTTVLRVSVDAVVLGGGKIQLPVLLDDWQNSKNVTQYCMRGSLHPDTLIIAVENFTQKRVREGLLVYEQSKKAGRLIFDFAQLASGAVYATAEDNIMLERASEPPYINFTFGRNLYWYVKSQKDKAQQGTSKENDCQGLNHGASTKTPTKLSAISKATTTPGGRSPSGHGPTAAGPMGSGGAPPPPPIPQALRALQLDANGVPMCGTPPPPPGGKKRNRKVRQLYWTKIPQNQLAGTIWREKGSPSRVGVDIDVDELEKMFSLSPMKVDGKSANGLLSTGIAAASAPPKVQLLDLKRANNGAVLLSQFKNLEYGDIRNALISMDERRVLTIENLISLKYLFPLTDQERHDMINFKGDPKQCGPAEQFYLATLDVPRPDVRIRMLIFRHQYMEVMQQLEAAMHIFQQGSQELVESDKLAQVLQLVLKLGRALNDGSTSSTSHSAAGFRLDSLAKLADTKAKDKKTSVLDYLVSLTMKQKPELAEFWTDIPFLQHVAKLPTETIAEGLKEVKDNLDALKLELELISVNMSQETIDKSKAILAAGAATLDSVLSSVSDFIRDSTSSSSSDLEVDAISAQKNTRSPLETRESTEEGMGFEPLPSRFADAYFHAHMTQFYERTLSHYLLAKKRYDGALHAFDKAIRYFGEDPKTAQAASFFALLTDFVDNWKASKARIDKMASDREKAELKAQREAEKKRIQEELRLQKELEAQMLQQNLWEEEMQHQLALEAAETVEQPSNEGLDSLEQSTIPEIHVQSYSEGEDSEIEIVIAEDDENSAIEDEESSDLAEDTPSTGSVLTSDPILPLPFDEGFHVSAEVDDEIEFVPFEEMTTDAYLEF
jgi:hypothetical protein